MSSTKPKLSLNSSSESKASETRIPESPRSSGSDATTPRSSGSDASTPSSGDSSPGSWNEFGPNALPSFPVEQNSPSDRFSDYVNKIFDAIGIEKGPTRTKLVDGFNQYNDKQKYIFLHNEKLMELFNQLLAADYALSDLFDKGLLSLYRDQISNSWNKTINQLGKLQVYAILQKINKDDCSPVINELLDALNNKLGIVNNLIENNLVENIKPDMIKKNTSVSPLDNICLNFVSFNIKDKKKLTSDEYNKLITEGANLNISKEQINKCLRENKVEWTEESGKSAPGTPVSGKSGKQKYFAIGGSDNLYKAKYLKYKQKYLQIKNNL
jgi:hypothetical protein